MGQSGKGNLSIYSYVFGVVLLYVIVWANAALGDFPIDAHRDPRQLTVMVGDFDGTVVRNVGYYRLRRAATVAEVDPYFSAVSGLAEEIRVPVNDFEGNTGPQIGKLIGKLDGLGHFVASAAIEPVKLSNGETIVPGYYYLDPQYGYREFRPPETGKESFLVSSLKEKLENEEPFLLEAFAFLSLGFDKEFSDRLKTSILTRRGHDPAEVRAFLRILRKKFNLGTLDWPDEAFVNLSSPRDIEFAFSKGQYVQKMYYALTERMMQNHSVPHYLVIFENDRHLIKEIDAMFRRLSNSGIFNNPVIPVLVNLVEPEVFANPDGMSWDVSPLTKFTTMSRVTLYKPMGQVERTNSLSYLYEMILGVSEEEGHRMLKAQMSNPFQCRDALVDRADSGEGS